MKYIYDESTNKAINAIDEAIKAIYDIAIHSKELTGFYTIDEITQMAEEKARPLKEYKKKLLERAIPIGIA